MKCHLRIARPVTDIARSTAMYCAGLRLRVLGSFEDHDGFDGAMLGSSATNWHFEFTHCRTEPVLPNPTKEDLTVFYIEDRGEWEGTCKSMLAAGFRQVASFNPYWESTGRTFEDPDGYRIVLQNAAWKT